MVKKPLVTGLGRPAGIGNATHSSILAWSIPSTEEPGGLQSIGSNKFTGETDDAGR